jgi:glycosyltransferase involved in cell wall biosynthesis
MQSELQMTQLVSVVIPTYNHGHLLGRALKSVFDQIYTNWEIIVIDNNSQDNTDAVVQEFASPRVRMLRINNNGVIAASRNAGINAANGDWVAFLDSDDWWVPEKLQLCMSNASEDVDFIHHDLLIAREKSTIFQRRKISSWQVRSPPLVDLLVRGNAICNSSVVVRRALLNKVGGLSENPEMAGSEDYNLWLKIARVTDKFLYIHRPLGYYWDHAMGISRKDMSRSAETATAEFINFLGSNQKNRFQSRIKYIKGRHAYLNKNFENARPSLKFSLFYGDFSLRLKSLSMLLMSGFR